MNSALASRERLAELTSGSGALVLGLGLGSVAGDRLGDFSLILIVVGLLAHSWGMFDKQRTRRETQTSNPRWSSAAYWICWVLLGGVAFAVLARLGGML